MHLATALSNGPHTTQAAQAAHVTGRALCQYAAPAPARVTSHAPSGGGGGSVTVSGIVSGIGGVCGVCLVRFLGRQGEFLLQGLEALETPTMVKARG